MAGWLLKMDFNKTYNISTELKTEGVPLGPDYPDFEWVIKPEGSEIFEGAVI